MGAPGQSGPVDSLYRQEPSRGREYESASTQAPPAATLAASLEEVVKINDRYSNPPLHPDIAPGFLPPRLWQGRGKDGQAQREWKYVGYRVGRAP